MSRPGDFVYAGCAARPIYFTTITVQIIAFLALMHMFLKTFLS